VSVTNQDSNNCSETTFNVATNLPANWSANSPALSLVPGQTKTASVTVTSASNVADGFYDLLITASNGSQPVYAKSDTVSYVVSSTSANTAPNANNDNVQMAALAPVIINVLANDGDADNDPIYISAVGSAAKGSISVNSDGSLTYTPAKRFKDSDSFSYSISDGQASASAVVNLSLQSGSDGGSDDGGTDTGGNGAGNGGGKGGGKPNK